MDEDNPGIAANAARWPRAKSPRANKRRIDSRLREETSGENSRSKRRRAHSSEPATPLPLPPFPLWPLSHPGEGTVPPALGSISMVPYPSPAHHQPLFPTPTVVWPPTLTTPTTVYKDTSPSTVRITSPKKGPATPSTVNDDLAYISSMERPRGASLHFSASLGPQEHPNSEASLRKPRLEDLLGPPAAKRPLQTIRVLASAALRSEPKGKLNLEDMVDRICSRFDYFQDSQNRAKLKVRLASLSCNMVLIEMIEEH